MHFACWGNRLASLFIVQNYQLMAQNTVTSPCTHIFTLIYYSYQEHDDKLLQIRPGVPNIYITPHGMRQFDHRYQIRLCHVVLSADELYRPSK